MNRDGHSRKISKACESCRRRKVRCNGQEPCQNCEANKSACVYRLKARIKKRTAGATADAGSSLHGSPLLVKDNAVDGPSPRWAQDAPPDGPPAQHASEQENDLPVHQSVTATHGTDESTPDSSQLFYGPSSNFAFLQQVHRGILSHGSQLQACNGEVQEVGPGLDLFMQRIFFFGPSSRFQHREAINTLDSIVSLEQATAFLQHYKAGSRCILPFFTHSELDHLLHDWLAATSAPSACTVSQKSCILLGILAVGALSTDQTSVAELLYARSKACAAMFEEAVTLSMIQHSLVMAEYQINIGRPNSAYLHLGVACRKAFAMGLHKEAANVLAMHQDLEKRRATLWCLYFHENWHALAMGRKSSLKMSDISCPLPEDQDLARLCQLASIAENGTEVIYGQKHDSLRQLYLSAEKIHTQLRQFAERFGIGSASANLNNGLISDGVALLQLHNVYYHSIVLTFRPFLIADSALQAKNGSISEEQMWLRQACRYATDAAQDSIVFGSNAIQSSEACRRMRYNSFFFESCCAVLFYDILWHPSKHPYNLEFIQMALRTLDSMVFHDPVANARRSIERILRVVEQTISVRQNSSPQQFMGPAPLPGGQRLIPSSAEGLATAQDHQLHSSILFPSLNANASTSNTGDLIYFSDRNHPQLRPAGLEEPYNLPLEMGGTQGPEQDPGSSRDFNFDILTTDLYNMFPLQITTPEDGFTQ